MKDLLLIVGMLIIAGAIGAYLYFYTPASLHTGPYAAPSAVTSMATSSAYSVVSFDTLELGTQASTTARGYYAASDADGLAKLWAIAFGKKATVPAIDLATSQVIGVFAGMEPTGGYAIEVSKVVDSSTARTVYVTLVTPGPKCMSTEQITSPYELITLPASTLPLAHVDATSTRDCN
jgi:hypothetical protein